MLPTGISFTDSRLGGKLVSEGHSTVIPETDGMTCQEEENILLL